ncbi:MAG: efflux RND transporter periplasmic adaptor subunit [Myxococcota bacterium]
MNASRPALLASPARGEAMDRPLPRSRRVPTVAWVAVGLALFLGALWWFGLGQGRRLRVDQRSVEISTVRSGAFEDYIPVRGRIAPRVTVFLDALEGGRVEEVFVEDGAKVSRGQKLVVLSNTALLLDAISREAQVAEQLNNIRTLELQLEQNRLGHRRELVEANFQLSKLEEQIARREKLVAPGAVAEEVVRIMKEERRYWKARRDLSKEAQGTDLRLQKAQLAQLRRAGEQLQKNLTVARSNLDTLVVKSPIDGKLTALNAELGQSIAPGERIGQVDDPRRYKVQARLDEFYLPRLDVGQTAALADPPLTLKVHKIYPQVTAGQFTIDLVFQDEQPPGLRRGQTLQLRLTLGEATDALLIPNGAFYQDTGGAWILVVSPDRSRAVRRTVRLGRRNARDIEVLEGLEAGEAVITSPYTSFREVDQVVLAP